MKRFLLLAAGACALLVLFTWFQKKIVLVVEDHPQSLTTFSLTVGGALRAAHIPLGAADQVDPPPDAWLSEGQTIRVDRAAAVQINIEGQATGFISTARRPIELLAEAGIDLQPGDALLASGLPVEAQALLPQAETYSLQIVRLKTLTLNAGAGQTVTSTAATVGQALWEAGIRLRATDHLTASSSTPLLDGLAVEWTPARPITILTAAGKLHRYTAAGSVGEALAEAGLAPQGLDYAIPPVGDAIPAGGTIRLVRLHEEVLIEQTTLPFGTELQPVDDLELDQRQLVRPGEYGIQASRVRVRYEDGQEIGRVVESEWQAQAPVDEIVGYGTKIVMHTLETPDGTITYYRALQFWATAYAPKYVGGSTRTASGKTLRKGLVGVDTSYIPYGTLMYVPGYGFAEAADTGRIVGRWIDLGYSDDDFEGWHQWVTVYFLWPPGYVAPVIPPPSHY
ncbi:MAG: ubiquitin-like domain-containing protein [Chloroflexota bacterium]